MNTARLALFTLLAFTLLLAALVPVDARHHHRKRVEDEFEYRDMDEYEELGLFVDAVPMKPTPHPKNIKAHHKTNRLPKLRKFLDNKLDYFH